MHQDVCCVLIGNDFEPSILLEAAKSGDVESVHEMAMTYDANVDSRDSNGNTALLLAVINNRSKIVDALLTYDANPSIPNNKWLDPLTAAVRNKVDPEIIKWLLGAGVNVNYKDKQERTAIEWAVIVDNVEALQYLKEEIWNVNELNEFDDSTLLMRATSNNSIGACKWLLENFEIAVDATNSKGNTALLLAVKRKADEEIIDMLLNNAVDVNHKDRWGRTAIQWAVKINNYKAFKKLLKIDYVILNINKLDEFADSTLLMWAVSNGSVEMCKLLLRVLGIDINYQNGRGLSALFMAVDKKHIGVCQLLLNHKDIDINIENVLGETAFVFAVFSDNRKIVNMFLQMDELKYDAKEMDELAHSSDTRTMLKINQYGKLNLKELWQKKKSLWCGPNDYMNDLRAFAFILNHSKEYNLIKKASKKYLCNWIKRKIKFL